MEPQLIAELRAIVGASRVLVDPRECEPFGRDWTTFWQARPGAVVLPGSTDQVQQVVQLANRRRLAIVPSGGRTGLSGGAMACNGELVLALDRMDRIIDVDPVAETLTCQAGAITRTVQEEAARHNLMYPVDFASSGSSRIGGNIATNAGGIKVIRYGDTRHWVRGLKVVTGAGEQLDLNRGLVKNNSGYDLRHLFIASEGTLGIICEATLALTRPPRGLGVMVLSVADFAALPEVLHRFKAALTLTAFEFFSHRAMAAVTERTGNGSPFADETPFYALVEFERGGDADERDALAAFEDCVADHGVRDGVLAQSQTQAANLWALRENITESLSPRAPYKSDLSVPIAAMPAFVRDIEALMANRFAGLEVVWFGHLGDGNIHLNVLKPDDWTTDRFAGVCASLGQSVAERVEAFGGSISAEHGIGLLKKDTLHFSRSPGEIELMKQIKRIFDPEGIMNPGKIFD
jgi:FAD/FMN-containing dehydrogenase